MSSSLSKRLGETLAHVQDFFDTLVHVGIRRAAETGQEKGASEARERSGMGRLLGFFTEVGDAYYRKYGDIKSGEKENRDDG